jgi:hypothetical protein
MTEINFDVLEGAYADAKNEAHGFTHNQGDYAAVVDGDSAPTPDLCKTGLCLAGFIGVRAGAKLPPIIDHPSYRGGRRYWHHKAWFVNPDTGEYDENGEHISAFAARQAGLSYSQSDALFGGGNTLEDIREMIDQLRVDPTALDDYGD